MKNSILTMIIVSILLQGCFSYRKIPNKFTTINYGETYKIKIDNKLIKGKLISFNDSMCTFRVRKNEISFKTSKINKIKQRKFSVAKTIVLTTTITIVGIIGLFITTYSGPELKGDIMSPN